MNKSEFDVNSLRIASPCSVGWENMTGDERTRHCQACDLNVYNISALSVDEVERLITSREVRTCIRMYRRADGTVLTRDCPVGLRGYQKRVARFAGATLGAILGLFSIGFGQKEEETRIDVANSKMVTLTATAGPAAITGIVIDPNGAVIPNVRILLFKAGEKLPTKTVSGDSGTFRFSSVSTGEYRIEVTSVPSFKPHFADNIKVESGKLVDLTLTLALSADAEWVGLLASDVPAEVDIVRTPVLEEIQNRLPVRIN